MKSDNAILEKSFRFAIRIVRLYQHLLDTADNRILANQILKSGTSIGANVREALRSQSRNEFLSKMNISLKEAYETEYWIDLLHETGYLTSAEHESLFPECRELTAILSKIIRTTKANTTG